MLLLTEFPIARVVDSGLDPYALGAIDTKAYNGIAKYPLIAIPPFVLTGIIFERSAA